MQNPDGNAGGEDGAVDGTVQNPGRKCKIWAKRLTAMVPRKGDVQNRMQNAGGAIDGEGAASGDVQNPDANVSDGNGTNDGTVQNPDTNVDGENTDHSNTNTGKKSRFRSRKIMPGRTAAYRIVIRTRPKTAERPKQGILSGSSNRGGI